MKTLLPTRTLRTLRTQSTTNRHNITMNNYENKSTNIINFFDKLDENNLDVRGLMIYLSNLNIIEIYKIHTFMNTIQCINFDKDKIYKMAELIKNPEFLSMKVHDIVGNHSLLMSGGGEGSSIGKMIKGGGIFKQFLRLIYDGRKCLLCQQGANYVTREGNNLGPLHKLHIPRRKRNNCYFHETCLQNYCIVNNVINEDGNIICPGCERRIRKEELTMSHELCIPSASHVTNILVDDAITFDDNVLGAFRDLPLYRVPSNDVMQDPDDPALIEILPNTTLASLLFSQDFMNTLPYAINISLIIVIMIHIGLIMVEGELPHQHSSRQQFDFSNLGSLPRSMRFGGKNKKNKTRKIKKNKK